MFSPVKIFVDLTEWLMLTLCRTTGNLDYGNAYFKCWQALDY